MVLTPKHPDLAITDIATHSPFSFVWKTCDNKYYSPGGRRRAVILGTFDWPFGTRKSTCGNLKNTGK